MGIFHNCSNCKQRIEELELEKKQLWDLVEKQAITIVNLSKCCKKANPVKLSVIFNHNLNPNKMSLELKSGQTSVGTLVLTDVTTGLPVPATFDTVSATGFDATIATVIVNADGTLTATGVAAGVTGGTVSANASFSDSNGVAVSSSPLSFTETITVDAVIPPAHPVTLSVSWSIPA